MLAGIANNEDGQGPNLWGLCWKNQLGQCPKTVMYYIPGLAGARVNEHDRSHRK